MDGTRNDLACNDDSIAIAIVALHCKQAWLMVEIEFVCTHFREFDVDIDDFVDIDRIAGPNSDLSSSAGSADDSEMTKFHNPVGNE